MLILLKLLGLPLTKPQKYDIITFNKGEKQMDWGLVLRISSDLMFIAILLFWLIVGQILPFLIHNLQFYYQKPGLYIDPVKARKKKIFYKKK